MRWLLIAAVAVATALLIPAASTAQSTFVYRQLPLVDGSAGFSDGARVRWADDFRLVQPTTIRNITWWGSRPSAGDYFGLAIYTDDNGQPGLPLPALAFASWDIDRNHSHIGRDFQYTGVLDTPVELSDGTRYWLSLIHPPVESWLWTGAVNQGPAVYQMNGGSWIVDPRGNLAFALSTDVPEPKTTLLSLLGLAALWWTRKRHYRECV